MDRQIYQEKVSGVGRTRPEFQRMMQEVRKDDVLVIWRLERLARSTKMLLEIVEQLTDKAASFKSLEEPWADTTSATGRLVMTFFAGLAEFERDLIRDRTGAGREAALERGVKFGRPTKMTEEQLKIAKRYVLKQAWRQRLHHLCSCAKYTTRSISMCESSMLEALLAVRPTVRPGMSLNKSTNVA